MEHFARVYFEREVHTKRQESVREKETVRQTGIVTDRQTVSEEFTSVPCRGLMSGPQRDHPTQRDLLLQ